MRGFHKLGLYTLIAVYFLIWVGSTVRSTGAGMGCPDWPRCFGQWVPPTSAEQLPDNYKEIYSAHRDKKNQKFIKYLRVFGMNEVADKIATDKSILVEADFNSTLTWIEYLNRLTGVIVGFMIVALFFLSRKFIKAKAPIFWFSLATLILVIIQGWFGSIVVSTNLTTWTITLHMLMALVLVAILVYVVVLSDEKRENIVLPNKGLVQWLVVLCIATLLAQVFLGTQVRQALDRLASAMVPRESWIAQAGWDFIVHRSFSWIVLIVHVVLVIKLRKTSDIKALRLGLIVLLLLTLVTGTAMAYLAIPAFLQPVHLTLATITFGTQLLLLFRLSVSDKKVVIY